MQKRWVSRRDAILIFLIGICFLGGAVVLWAASLQTPDLRAFEERRVFQSTKIYDRTGEVLLYDLHQDVQRTVIPASEVSRHIKNATVAIEDAAFYQHAGIRPLAVLRAVLVNLGRLEFSQGGSTITQQVIKKTLLVDDKKISRKLKEWALALKLEQVMTKDEILGVYLNESPYGGSIYGIEEAAQSYFGKSARDVTLAEAAYLAALPQAPTFYSPYGSHTDRLEERKNLVLAEMRENKFITQEEYEEARAATVEFLPPRKNGILAPHFVFFVREYLEEKYGRAVLDERGLKVTTTLDVPMQQAGEEIVNRYALENEEKFNAENAGLVAIDPSTGQIRAMVGSRDYFDPEIDGNVNVTVARRQPGSSFKPFVYATAFEKGYTPDTVVFDVRTQFSSLCAADNFTSEGECYSPGNYDNVFRGPVTLRNALAQSINVPAVKTLYLAGLGDSLRTARALGISTLGDKDRYGLTLVLGGGEVTLLEMTGAYGVFAQNGVRHPPTAILKVEDGAGNVLEEFADQGEQVIPEAIALTINDVLSDNAARTPAFGENSYLYFPGRDVAAKTGTTDDYRDAWVVGYTPNLAVGAWAGNNDNSPMQKKVAGFIIAPLWHAFLEEALPMVPEARFIKPEYHYDLKLAPIVRGLWQGGKTYVVDKLSGKLATDLTPPELREERAVMSVHSILHWVDKKDPTSGTPPQNPFDDPQYRLWEPPVRAWALQNGYLDQNDSVIPVATDDVHTAGTVPTILITSPANGATLRRGESVAISVQIGGRYAPTRVDYYVNNLFLGSTTRAPFSYTFRPDSLPELLERNTIEARVVDASLQQAAARAEFTIAE